MFIDDLLDSRSCPRYGDLGLNSISVLGNTCRHHDHETNKINEMLEMVVTDWKRGKKVIKI